MIHRCAAAFAGIALMTVTAHAGDHSEAFDATTTTTQAVGGVVATVGVGIGVAWATKRPCSGLDCIDLAPLVYGTFAGLVADIVSVQLIGDAFGGRGTLGYTLLGTGVGALAGFGLLGAAARGDAHLGVVGGIAALTLPLVAGTVLGYQLGSGEDAPMALPLVLFQF